MAATPPISFTKDLGHQDLTVSEIEELEKKVLNVCISRIPDILLNSNVKGTEFPEKTQQQLIFGPLEQLAKKSEEMFKTSESKLSSKSVDFISQGLLQIVTNLVETANNLPPNIIVECGVNEAAFSHALDLKPVIATDSLATCVGVAGYESENKCGFVIHFATEVELETSKEMLVNKIKQMSKKPVTAPIQIHLRGGIAGQSEPLVQAIEKWVQSSSEKGCPMAIVSKNVLTKGLLNEHGVINAMSLSLDTREGLLSTYDCSANPYSTKQKIQVTKQQEVEDLVMRILESSLKETPEIKVVYFPFNI